MDKNLAMLIAMLERRHLVNVSLFDLDDYDVEQIMKAHVHLNIMDYPQ